MFWFWSQCADACVDVENKTRQDKRRTILPRFDTWTTGLGLHQSMAFCMVGSERLLDTQERKHALYNCR